MGDGAVVGCASLRGVHRLHAYEVYSTRQEGKCCCRVAQLQPEMELTSAAALGRALRQLSDGGKTLSCSRESDTAALRRAARETGENSSRCRAATAAHDGGGGGQVVTVVFGGSSSRRPVTMRPVMGAGIESRVCR